MATAVRIVVNPANTKQRYILWSNGRIDAQGGALPFTQGDGQPLDFATLLGSPGARLAPTWYSVNDYPAACALQITDWAGPGGYVLSPWGKVWPIGTGPELAGPSWNWWGAGVTVVDFTCDPAGGGGYYLQANGSVQGFGTKYDSSGGGWAPGEHNIYALVHGGGGFRRIVMDWATLHFITYDMYGRVFSSATSPGIVGSAPVVTLAGAGQFAVQWWNQIGAALLIYDKTNMKGWATSLWGHILSANGAATVYGAPFSPGLAWETDVAIVDSGQTGNPIELVALFNNGWFTDWKSSLQPSVLPGGAGLPVDPTIDTSRPTIGWTYRNPDGAALKQWEVIVMPSSVWNAGGYVSEVQSLAVTGAPTGGTIGLTFDMDPLATTATLVTVPWNATAAQVQTVLEGVPGIGVGNVLCAGGPLPGSAVSITFRAKMAKHPYPLLDTRGTALTGGAAPAAAITRTTAGTGPALSMIVDESLSGAVYQQWGTDPKQASIVVNRDLPNDATGLRAYIRLTSTSGQDTGWRPYDWVQNVPAMPVPTVTPTVLGGVAGVSLLVHVAAPPAGTVVALQYQDSDTAAPTVWNWVRGASATVLDGSGNATVVDAEAKFGILRNYRAMAYVPAPYKTGTWSASATATLSPQSMFALTNPLDSTQGGLVSIVAPPPNKKLVNTGVFYPAGRLNAVVVSDGPPKGGSALTKIDALNKAARLMLKKILESDATLLYRTPFGQARYVRVIGNLIETPVRAAPAAGETTSVRDYHQFDVEFQTVDPPLTGPTANVGTTQLLDTLAPAWQGPPAFPNLVTP
jgi:hypothetical protein